MFQKEVQHSAKQATVHACNEPVVQAAGKTLLTLQIPIPIFITLTVTDNAHDFTVTIATCRRLACCT